MKGKSKGLYYIMWRLSSPLRIVARFVVSKLPVLVLCQILNIFFDPIAESRGISLVRSAGNCAKAPHLRQQLLSSAQGPRGTGPTTIVIWNLFFFFFFIAHKFGTLSETCCIPLSSMLLDCRGIFLQWTTYAVVSFYK